MWITLNGSCSAPTIMSMILASPMRAPQRLVGATYGPRLIDSAPPPIATSVSPSRIDWAADTMACSPLPHSRFTFIAATPSGRPPSIAATRDRYMSRGSVLITCPNATWPTESAATPARRSASRTTVAASWVGARSFRLPPKVPMAVRTALTMTTSRMLGLPGVVAAGQGLRTLVRTALSPFAADGGLTGAALRGRAGPPAWSIIGVLCPGAGPAARLAPGPAPPGATRLHHPCLGSSHA